MNILVNILVDIPNEINRQTTTVKPGQRRLIGSLVCAALAFTVVPVMFGRLGVVARTVSLEGCQLDDSAKGLLQTATQRSNLSARALIAY